MPSESHLIDRAPPEDVPAEGSGGGGWAWLLTAGGVIEAQLVRGVLEGSGIVPVALDGRDPSPSAWLFLSGNVNAPVRVFVPSSLLQSARLALLEAGLSADDPPPATSAARPAPRWMWLVAAILSAIVILMIVSATVRASATCMLRVVC